MRLTLALVFRTALPLPYSTIHQPSSLLFESFDNVLLLEAGGRTAIMSQIGRERGHGSDLVREYFERNGGPKCEPHENVGEYQAGKSQCLDRTRI